MLLMSGVFRAVKSVSMPVSSDHSVRVSFVGSWSLKLVSESDMIQRYATVCHGMKRACKRCISDGLCTPQKMPKMKVDGNEVSLLYQQVGVCGEVCGAGM